jgi:D-sedoheptulose 7-phosphate isomerase
MTTQRLEFIKSVVESSILAKTRLLGDVDLIETIADAGAEMQRTLGRGGKVIFAGNGGSFGDAQHLTAEFISKLNVDRVPLAAIALGTNNSSISAIGNDYGYEDVFSRELEALGSELDCFIPISTSGNSRNIIKAVFAAKQLNMPVFALTGDDGGELSKHCRCVKVPSKEVARIQECHILLGHVLCEIAQTHFLGGTA